MSAFALVCVLGCDSPPTKAPAPAEPTVQAEPVAEPRPVSDITLRLNVPEGAVYEQTTTLEQVRWDGSKDGIRLQARIEYFRRDGKLHSRAKLVSAQTRTPDGGFEPADAETTEMMGRLVGQEPAPEAPGLDEQGGRDGQFAVGLLLVGEIPLPPGTFSAGHQYVVAGAGTQAGGATLAPDAEIRCTVGDVGPDQVSLSCEADISLKATGVDMTKSVKVTGTLDRADGVGGKRVVETRTTRAGSDKSETERTEIENVRVLGS